MKFGTKEINSFKLGNKRVLSVWYGTKKIWDIYSASKSGSILTINNAPATQSGSEVTII